MKVKAELIKANRLEQVFELLNSICCSKDYDFPVALFMDDDNTAKSRVDGCKVREQAKLLIEQIEKDDVQVEVDFWYLYHLIKNKAEMNMHNYANDALHRAISSIDLERTRVLVIVKSLIESRTFCTEDNAWSIPTGWAA